MLHVPSPLPHQRSTCGLIFSPLKHHRSPPPYWLHQMHFERYRFLLYPLQQEMEANQRIVMYYLMRKLHSNRSMLSLNIDLTRFPKGSNAKVFCHPITCGKKHSQKQETNKRLLEFCSGVSDFS